MKTLVADTETNGLLDKLTKIHCIAAVHLEADELLFWGPDEIEQGLAELASADVLWFHNGIDFDLPAIRKVYPDWQPKPGAKMRDSILMARMIWPEIKLRDKKRPNFPKNLVGAYSLEAFGHRLGNYKGDFKGPWDEYTEEMGAYCRQDVGVGADLVRKIIRENWPEQSVELEHDFAQLIRLQTEHGFPFDEEAAQRLYATLAGEREAARQALVDIFGWWWAKDKVVTPKQDNKRWGYTAGAEVTLIKKVEFNPGSRHHIAKVLKERHGWKPEVFTPEGHPKIDEETIGPLPYPEVPALMRYLMVQKRISQLAEGKGAWLGYVKNGRIHGKVTTVGTVTRRCSHSNPNLSQVPAVRSEFGAECRALFYIGNSLFGVMVGADASGIELRMLGHYMARYDGGAFALAVVDGDVHTDNQKAAGLYTRDGAKTFVYAYLYGAGDEKLGIIFVEDARRWAKKNPDQPEPDPYAEVVKLRGSDEWTKAAKAVRRRKKRKPSRFEVMNQLIGSRLRARFEGNLPALAALKDDITRRVKERGYLIALDGGKLPIRSAHSALNTLLQSAGALVMKKAPLIAKAKLEARGWQWGREWVQVMHAHDEVQNLTRPELATELGETIVESIKEAGVFFKLRCRLDGEFKLGANWAETH